MSEKEEHQEKRRRKDSSSSSSSILSSSSSYSSTSDNVDKKAKKSSKYDKSDDSKIVKRREEKRSSPDKREGAKSHYVHSSRHKERDRKRDRTRSRSRDKKRERSYRRSKSPGYRHSSSHRHSRKDHERVRRRSRSRSFDRSMSRKTYSKSLKKLNMLEKLGIELKVPEGQPTLAQPTQIPGGVTIPSYYNPTGVNPLKYVQQMQKRKLLWGNSQKQTTQTSTEKVEEKAPVGPETVWKGTSFSNDQDGKLTAKFKRLMGMKSTEDDKTPEGSGSNLIKKQEEIFESMEKQYEVARVATHTHRGLGLGFGVHQPR